MLTQLLSMLSQFVHLILGITSPNSFPPPMSSEEERQCFRALEQGDANARNKLILHNLRLVSHIVRKYYSSAKDPDDLVSIGTLGLVKAVDTFRLSAGSKFATYAARCIQNEILMHFRSQKKYAAEVSLNETIDIDRDGNPLTYIDVICSDEDIVDEIDRKIMTGKMMRCVQSVLTPRERQIISMRFGLGGQSPKAQREVALVLGISRSYVSRIEKSALEKLRVAMK